MEIIVIIVGGLLGWKHGTFGPHEFKFMGLVIAGWTAVMTAASVPYLSLTGFVTTLLNHTMMVTVPYAVGVLANRLSRRRR